ncbi:MAG TPA: FG-GAP-like repeat-containing protein [Candidatus Sulfotelmatobacter sp.]|nr:FG-GAP-like repeat-containing protein [Candidatus Sulfotelmatobacter sp.]
MTALIVVVVLSLGATASAQFETRGVSVVSPLPGPVSVATGDFNHDGKLDMAVASSYQKAGQYSDQVTVFLGNGDGTFQAGVNYTVGSNPVSVAAADFNKDGNLDLIVANARNNTLSVLLGNGDGTFQTAVNFATPQDPIFVAVADFNGDGKLDLVTVNLSDSTGYCDCVAVFLGNGDGTFQEPPIITTPPLPAFALGVGRFNSDSKLDLVVAEEFGGTNQIQVLLGNGDGTFQMGSIYPDGAGASAFAVADFNGDHKLDLAVAEGEGMGVGVFLGNGDGTFNPREDYHTISPPLWVAAMDFNGDGKKDLVAANFFNPSGVTVLMGNGDGTFQPGVYYADGGLDDFVTVADLNSDHKPDIVVLDFNGDAIVLLNTGAASFLPNTPLAFGDQVIGTTSRPLTVKLTNSGQTSLTISSMTASSQFDVSSTCGTSVAPGASCNIKVTFTPLSKDAKAGTVSIRDSASSKPQIIELSGSGTVVEFSPSSLTFPPQKVGTKSAPQNVQVTNTGTITLNLLGIWMEGFDPNYSETNNCGFSLRSHASCTVAVTFQPTKTGTLKANVLVTDDGGGSPQRVPLTGTGN